MKHCLITGLVLAVSFVLMLPPENQDNPGTFNTKAPLSEWQPYASKTTGIQEGAGNATEFPALRQCIAAKLAWANRWKTLGNRICRMHIALDDVFVAMTLRSTIDDRQFELVRDLHPSRQPASSVRNREI